MTSYTPTQKTETAPRERNYPGGGKGMTKAILLMLVVLIICGCQHSIQLVSVADTKTTYSVEKEGCGKLNTESEINDAFKGFLHDLCGGEGKIINSKETFRNIIGCYKATALIECNSKK